MLRSALIRGTAPPKLLVSGTPPHAAVVLDGVLVGHAPVNLEVAPGSHTVELQAAGQSTQSHRWDADLGLDEVVDYALTPAPKAQRGARIGGWLAVALGLAGGGAGAALLILDGDEHGPTCGLDQRDGAGKCPNVYTTAVAGIVSASVGAAALAGGLGLLIYDARRGRKRPVAGLAPAGLGIHVEF